MLFVPYILTVNPTSLTETAVSIAQESRLVRPGCQLLYVEGKPTGAPILFVHIFPSFLGSRSTG